MATGFSDKVPPPFNGNTDDFAKWKRKYELWKQITEVAPTKQRSLLVLRLDEDTQDTILELLTSADLAKEDGADQVVKKLEDMTQFKAPPTFRGHLKKKFTAPVRIAVGFLIIH